MEVLNAIAEQLQLGDDEQVRALTEQAIAQGVEPKAILDDGLIAGMNAIGGISSPFSARMRTSSSRILKGLVM